LCIPSRIRDSWFLRLRSILRMPPALFTAAFSEDLGGSFREWIIHMVSTWKLFYGKIVAAAKGFVVFIQLRAGNAEQ
jgi:hypothetical protein